MEILLAGYYFIAKGIPASITKAITHFPLPTNQSELQSFTELVNQLSSHTTTFETNLATPWHQYGFLWTAEHVAAIYNSKNKTDNSRVTS